MPAETLTPVNSTPAVAAAKSDALATATTQRTNIPINLSNWEHLPAETAGALLWFHQHILDTDTSLKGAGQKIGYDPSVVFKVLKGTYEGSWANIVARIRSYQKIAGERSGIQKADFSPNSISHLIWGGLDYAAANNSITLIVGESGLGKTVNAEKWRDDHNHGRTVMIEVPPIGGQREFLNTLARAVGVSTQVTKQQGAILNDIVKAFNPHRGLLVDEAHRLLPAQGPTNPVKLEILRYIHDKSGCFIGLLATERFDASLKKSSYQYEQVLGRIGQPVRLFRSVDEKDFLPILAQYFKRPSAKLIATVKGIVNEQGRIRVLCQILKVASRIASNKKQALEEEHFFKALALRHQMMGETMHARKEAK